MEVPLSPLEFMRRARTLYGSREAVVDGQNRWTYDAFFERCDRWSSVLRRMGIRKGDRVAYISPNTHAQLESFYAVPQIGAVLVPINYRLADEEFASQSATRGEDLASIPCDGQVAFVRAVRVLYASPVSRSGC